MVIKKIAILFSGTIAGNLRQGNQGASETELQKAAEIAFLILFNF